NRLIRPAGHAFDMITTAFSVPANGERPEVQMVVAGNCDRSQKIIHEFRIALGALIAAASAAVFLLRGAVTRYGRRPLTRLSNEASQLSPVNRRQRLHTEALPKALHDL